ncbi:MAG: hypothetical protein DMF53_01875 [Acidobacteria bacterium]|nr:MAG: hypothetical protein DMF53_01875 [Acidobacteriota bacterium]
MPAAETEAGLNLGAQMDQGRLGRLDRLVRLLAVMVHRAQGQECTGTIDLLACELEERCRARQELLRLLEPALVLAQDPLEPVDLCIDQVIRYTLIPHQAASTPQALIRLWKVAEGAQDVGLVGDRARQSVVIARRIGGPKQDRLRRLRELVHGLGLGRHMALRFPHQPMGQRHAAKSTMGPLNPAETLRMGQLQKRPQILVRLPLGLLDGMRVPFEEQRQDPEGGVVADAGVAPPALPGLESRSARGAQMHQMVPADLYQLARGPLSPFDRGQQLRGDMDIGHGPSLSARTSIYQDTINPHDLREQGEPAGHRTRPPAPPAATNQRGPFQAPGRFAGWTSLPAGCSAPGYHEGPFPVRAS